MYIKAFKKELAWAIDKWLWLMSNTMFSYANKNLKNKAFFNLKQCCMYYYLVKPLCRNVQNLQVIFLQNLQDLVLKMKFILQDINNLLDSFLARFETCKKLSCNFSRKILAKFFISCNKIFIFSARLAEYVQDLAQDLASLARKIVARFA